MMSTRIHLGLLLALLALSLLSPASCYNPSIQDGGFFCAEAGKQCPAMGYVDRHSLALCFPRPLIAAWLIGS